jgi:hypothetical protein
VIVNISCVFVWNSFRYSRYMHKAPVPCFTLKVCVIRRISFTTFFFKFQRTSIHFSIRGAGNYITQFRRCQRKKLENHCSNWSRVLFEKLIVTHLLKYFAILLWNSKVYYHVDRACHRSLSWARWIQSTQSRSVYFKTHFNDVPAVTPRSSKWSLAFRFIH